MSHRGDNPDSIPSGLPRLTQRYVRILASHIAEELNLDEDEEDGIYHQIADEVRFIMGGQGTLSPAERRLEDEIQRTRGDKEEGS